MVIGQRVLSNVGFGNDVGIWEGSIVYEVLYPVLEAKQLLVLWPDFWWEWQYSLRFQEGGIGLGMGVGSKGLGEGDS